MLRAVTKGLLAQGGGGNLLMPSGINAFDFFDPLFLSPLGPLTLSGLVSDGPQTGGSLP